MTPIIVFLTLFAWMTPLRAQTANKPDYIECQNTLDCAVGHCCTIGPVRYSMPQCRPYQEEGKVCRPNSATAVNMTVGYPDGAQVELINVHYILCPCGAGLSCDAKEGFCKDTGEKREQNRLHGDNSEHDD